MCVASLCFLLHIYITPKCCLVCCSILINICTVCNTDLTHAGGEDAQTLETLNCNISNDKKALRLFPLELCLHFFYEPNVLPS